ncbi:MAG: tRNA 2-thiouridine(34) synthase MnmA [Patescibacteria group bacterium]
MIKKLKVFVGMSGGVDSSVAAYLLKKRGYDVVGVFMKNWTETMPSDEKALKNKFDLCPWVTDQEDMRKVCVKLKIPFYTFDFEKEYKEKVIDYFYKSYKKGITPNPDIMCNKEIKFKLFLDKCLSLGADFIATGHYAQILEVRNSRSKTTYQLLKGKDVNKDQSYFLCTLNQHQLSKTLFPIGAYTKTTVRSIAKKIGLPTHDKKDSQGICFIGEVDLKEFLKIRLKETPGKIRTTDGEIIGNHIGLPFYTIGQRKGINIGGGIPYYVVTKDTEANELIVAKGSHDQKLFCKTLIADHVHWIDEEPKFPLKCTAKIRYRQTDQELTVTKISNNVLSAEFIEPQRAITPGQSIVFYKSTVLIGSAVIT